MAGISSFMSFRRLGMCSDIAYCSSDQVGQNCSTKTGDDGFCRDRSEHSWMHEKVHDAGCDSKNERYYPSLTCPGNEDTYCGNGTRNDPGLRCYQQVARS